MSDDLDTLIKALSCVREDDCGNNELCADALLALGEMRLNLRLMRKRLDHALDRASVAESGRQEAMAALVEARGLILGANHGRARYPRAFVLLTGEVDRNDPL